MNPNVRIEHRDFIGVYENALTDEQCNDLIDQWKYSKEAGHTKVRQEYDTADTNRKNDESAVMMTGKDYEESKVTWWNQKDFLQYMKNAIVANYIEHYPALLEADYEIFQGKIQRTRPREGYHIWHCEVIGNKGEDRDRFLAWSVFLNDVEEGGETEFLHQSVRFKPKKGTAFVFPAYFTHLHRGNPPLSGEKYIATGWVEHF